MLKIEVPENDQSVYELKTESGETHFVRSPGEGAYGFQVRVLE